MGADGSRVVGGAWLIILDVRCALFDFGYHVSTLIFKSENEGCVQVEPGSTVSVWRSTVGALNWGCDIWRRRCMATKREH